LASNIKKEIIQVLDSFLSFFRKYEKRKAHNMLSLMLDPRFKILCLVSLLIGHEQGKTIVEEYDKCYYHLHLLVEFKRGVVDQNVEDDMNLDIFELITSTSEPTTELVNKKLLIFKHYQMDDKDIKCPLQWWEKHESMFPIVGFYARQSLGIVGFQIEIEKIFSLVEILISLKKCHLQLNFLDKLIFVSKNWPNDPKIGCKSLSS
jgi:hypothetical protein